MSPCKLIIAGVAVAAAQAVDQPRLQDRLGLQSDRRGRHRQHDDTHTLHLSGSGRPLPDRLMRITPGWARFLVAAALWAAAAVPYGLVVFAASGIWFGHLNDWLEQEIVAEGIRKSKDPA